MIKDKNKIVINDLDENQINSFSTPMKLREIASDTNTRKSHKPKLQSVHHISPRDFD